MIRPLADRVLILPDSAEEVTKGGIIIPTEAQEKNAFGTVVGVGPEVEELEEGDRVLYGIWAGQEISPEECGQERPCFMMRQMDILGKIQNQPTHE